MDATPKVSIILPAYNVSCYLQESITSVMLQSYTNWELIIIDDCSKDDSFQIACRNAQCDQRIKVLRNEKNKGVAFCRNLGIQEAVGDYIAFLDSDDIWVENKLEKQLALLIRTKAEFSCGSYDFIDERGNSALKPHIVPSDLDFRVILKENIILCSTVCVKTSILKAHHFQDDYYHEDYVLWLEIFRLPVKAVGNKEVLTHYRLAKGSRSHNKINAAIERWRIYRRFLKMGIVKSGFYFAHYAVNGIKKYYF